MAALQKIRSKGGLLIAIIGLGLFAFIAEEFFRSIETTANQSKQQVGKIYGEKISTQEFQNLFNEYEEALKFMQGKTALTDQESNQAKDQVWQTLVNYKLIKHECDKLGLTVTDGELQQVLNEGTNPMLSQTPFMNEKTGKFDANLLKNFLQEYDKMQANISQIPEQYAEYYRNLYNYWKFVEKSLRETQLMQKYQVLLSKCIISNPVEAKMNFDESFKRNDLIVASFPYTLVQDKDIQVSDEELKAKYEETKEQYRQFLEARDIKYISKKVTASENDQAELMKEMEGIAQKLQSAEDPTSVVRSANSLVPYSNMFITKRALPYDIQKQMDSLSVGAFKGPYYNESDNTDNIIKYIAKTEAPDSIKFCQIQVTGNTPEDLQQRADSIMTALSKGAEFDSIAKFYGQNGAEQWLASGQYETSSLDEETLKYLNALTTQAAGTTVKNALGQGVIITKVVERKAYVTKYNVAVIKRTVDFSKETYSKAYNDFSHFVASNTTLKDIEANAAKSGYTVETRENVFNNEHYVAGIGNTREAMRWLFDAKEGEVSPLYECGENDNLLLIALTKTHEVGFRPLKDVEEEIRAAIINEKKGEILANKLKDIKTFDAAKAVEGATIDSLKNVLCSGSSFVKSTGANEPLLNASVWNKKKDDFVGPVKGTNGVYVYQVIDQKEHSILKYVESLQKENAVQNHLHNLAGFISELYLNGKVTDKRYLFF